ncbi:hypothetical protein CPB83DRAFT_926291 [Crepidotus variabilis]|uniref:Uncharacterized protein n=1 Tax=Crepidotus variabilis TaxID=179855 RepID=A0A9P6JRA4_9AGAR|nr:hypothetical protein CPB83DRAFT_926291 [Crepidotus variabilis]
MPADNSPTEIAVYSASEKQILFHYVEDFRNGNVAKRREILDLHVLPALKLLKKNPKKLEWRFYRTGVKQWFHNNGRRSSAWRGLSAPRKPPVTQVLYSLYREAVKAKAKELSGGAEPGTSAWLAQFQPACQQVLESLSPANLDKLEAARTEWVVKAYPMEEQLRMLRKHGKKHLRNFADQVFRVFGMRVCILEYHPSPDQEDGPAFWLDLHDFTGNFDTNIPKMSDWSPEIVSEIEAGWQKYVVYAQKMAQPNASPGSTVSDPDNNLTIAKKKSLAIVLEHDTAGWPTLPLPPAAPNHGLPAPEKLKDAQALLRAFVTAHYQKASGRNTVKVPWNRLAANNRGFFAMEYCPPGLTLGDPSDMGIDAIREFLRFWRDRARTHSADEIFRFQTVLGSADDDLVAAPYTAQVARAKRKPRGRSQSTAPSRFATPEPDVLPPLPVPPESLSTQFDKPIPTSNLPPLDDLYPMPDQPHGPDGRFFTPDPTNLTDLRLTSRNDNMWADYNSVPPNSPMSLSQWDPNTGSELSNNTLSGHEGTSLPFSPPATTGWFPRNAPTHPFATTSGPQLPLTENQIHGFIPLAGQIDPSQFTDLSVNQPSISTSGHNPGNRSPSRASNNVVNGWQTPTSTRSGISPTNPLRNVTTSSINSIQTHHGSPAKNIIMDNVFPSGMPVTRPINIPGSQPGSYTFTFTQQPYMPKPAPAPAIQTNQINQNQPPYVTLVNEPVNGQTAVTPRPRSKYTRREATPPQTPITGPRHRTRTTNAEGNEYEMPSQMGKSTTIRKSKKKKPKK